MANLSTISNAYFVLVGVMSCIASINIFTYFASRANGNLVFFSTAIFIIICITTINIFINATAICDAYNITNAIFSSITAINIHINTTMGNIYFVALANSC